MLKAIDVYINFVVEHHVEPSVDQFKKLGYCFKSYYNARNEFKRLKKEELKKLESEEN